MIEFHAPTGLLQFADELADDAAYKVQLRAIAEVQKKIPKPKDLFDWLLDQPSATLLQLLAFAVSQSIDTTTNWMHRDDKLVVQPLVDALGVDFANAWTPTRAAFLDHVPRATIEKVVGEACGAEGVAQLKGLKKDATAATAERLLAGKRWLPPVLRASAAAKKKPAKKAAKKAAKKRGAK
jgi:ParB family chromosome partitioning protein